jgi:hypothetical protein
MCVWNSPCRSLLFPRQRRQKISCWRVIDVGKCSWCGSFFFFSPRQWRQKIVACCGTVDVNHRLVGNPKRKVWWVKQQISLSKKPRFIKSSRKKPNSRRWCLLASRQLKTIYKAPRPSFALPAATRNLHTTQPNTLLPTYDEVFNLTGLIETKEWA